MKITIEIDGIPEGKTCCGDSDQPNFCRFTDMDSMFCILFDDDLPEGDYEKHPECLEVCGHGQ
ncbi:MAG: hypothetical protein ACLQF0_09130 [Dissulfurispiraceae bacterium]